MRERDAYTPAAVTACERALRTLVARIGQWGPHFIVFGGLAPRYLVQRVPSGLEPHIGTTDIDVVIGVVVVSEDIPLYSTLERQLSGAGFTPSRSRSDQPEYFRWQREVDGVGVTLEFFCAPEDTLPGRLRRRPHREAGRLSAFALRGAELAGRDCTAVRLEGDTLDGGGVRSVEVRVANLLPFLALKAFALDGRVKHKDAYDIVWTLNAFEQGPASAAAYAAGSPVATDPDVSAAIDLLQRHFETLESAGPSLYEHFMSEEGDDDGRRQELRRYAVETVRRFLTAWETAVR
jgi:hypothetical protein